jgi:hypothetical protein
MKKWIIILAALTMTLSGCMKEDAEFDLNREDWLIGTWYEYYDPQIFAMDGSSVVTFSEDGAAQWRSYDLFSGKSWNFDYRYAFEKNILTIESTEDYGNFDAGSYEVIFLNRDEMAWQRVGTTYSKGTWASDYKHFLRSKDE